MSPNELRRRVEQAIVQHVDLERWEKLQAIEAAERDALGGFLENWNEKTNLDSVSE